jgi:hypothetical protein
MRWLDFDPSSHARESLEQLIRHPSSSVPAEKGAFLGYESFYTALPLEALLCLHSLLPSDPVRDMVVVARLAEGVGFLRRLQFQPGSGCISPHPQYLEGAVHFSLLDHHFRMDYGLHAMLISLQLLSFHHAKRG